ncbi:patatin [Chryseobacterium indologenes]|uniref:patatin-like phospholipase family protein n=1 Tax=Chryseobacterium indologenes TaxID=253 RepID=UPI000F5174F1|nr:patatin-like phospholipase family protein [Chryseobacterium indologenes]AYZ34207.1 patatin [Chryseobacterium indologenes]MBF6642729.1 patatin-like phospholipase family protein [Chryseobacterium indologenes]MBU3049525.1 patatin-like phospholipase family protein [Chryseobacterium indologenes]MEB4762774.1 patatin-like phospholipase family protein [Chryseobacterium indologenes]QQQ69221.1 patatin-like phospholipase family protein [Chryseobacterium indologenes]
MGLFSFKKKQPKVIGLTLSGGGMRGIAHIAVLKALEEYNLKPQIISGTSAGSIIGAFYSFGKTPDEMMEIVKETSFFSRSALKLSKNGIFSSSFILKLFKDYFPEDNFNILKIPVYVTATEMTHGIVDFFSEGELFAPLLASSSVPFILPPVRMGDKIYVDGGVLDNLPIEPIIDKCDFLIASHVNSISYDELNKMSLMKEFDRILHLAIAKSVYSKVKYCDLFLDPPKMTKFSLFNKKYMNEMFQQVYEYTCAELEHKGYRKSSGTEASE